MAKTSNNGLALCVIIIVVVGLFLHYEMGYNLDFFHEGVELAIKHLKQESSIIKDKNIRFVIIDEGWYESMEADYRGTQDMVNNIVNIPGIFAVIGHASNRLSEFSSLSYDKHGITFINIGATATFSR